MRLERLVLDNFCQHKYLSHVWHQGLNGIIGPNGSGKSNIVKAAMYAITGIVDNAGTKAENICQLADEKARSRVTLNLEHDGTKVEIIRVLRRGTSSCRINGGEQIDGDNAVTEAVMDVLGVDQRILSEYIFVPQRRMAGFVDETPGERNKTFGQLFDLARAETIYKLLDAEIKRTNPAQPSPELAPLRTRIANNQARRDELEAVVAKARTELKRLEPELARALVAKADNWEKSQRAVDAVAKQVEELTADLGERQVELAAVTADQAELVQAKAGAAQDIEAARATLVRWETTKKQRERQAAIQARQVALDAEPAAHPEPKPPPEYATKEAAARDLVALDELSHAIRLRKDLIAKFKDKPDVCPTCGAKTDAILAKATSYESELPALEADLAAVRKLQDAYIAYGREHARWEQWSREYRKRGDDLARDRKALAAGVEEVPTVDQDTCHEVVNAGETLERAIADTNIQVDQLSKELNRWTVRLDESKLKLVKLQEERGKAPDMAAVARAKGDLVSVELVEREANRGEGELKAIALILKSDEEMLTRLEEAERKAETDRLWVYHLGEVRKIMHHDRLPKIVAHNYLEILADDTNELLESFDADFRVSLGEGLNFAATFLRGRYAGTVSPAQRLSEGQKVLLALAFRVAVNSLFAGTAGLLCLDEPTESLDERNLACLEVAIGKMRDLSESRGLQCLLVTHEPSFEVLFDGVLRLVA